LGVPAGVRVRRAGPGDLEAVWLVERLSFDHPHPPGYLELLIRFRQGVFLVAELDGVVAGYVAAVLREGGGHILSVAVHPEQRRRGIGGLLMRSILGELRAMGVREVVLEVKRGSAAVRFYEKLGFKAVGVISRYYEDGADAVVMMTLIPEGF